MTAAVPLEEVPCPLCGAGDRRVVLRTTDINFGVPGIFTIVACTTCDMKYVSPRPRAEDLSRVYPDLYAAGYQHAHSSRYVRSLRRRLEFVRRVRPSGRLLEVGCAAGHFLQLARDAGYEVAGLEIDPGMARHAREQLGLDVTVSAIEDAALPHARYDLVCMFDVFEHTLNPVLALRRLRDALAPGGAVVIKVPHFGCWESRLWGRYWYGKDVPRDLLHFTPATLTRMLSRAGFGQVEIRHVGEPNYAVQSLIKWAGTRVRRPSGTVRAVASGDTGFASRPRVVQEAVFETLCFVNQLPTAMLATVGQGNSIVAVARVAA